MVVLIQTVPLQIVLVQVSMQKVPMQAVPAQLMPLCNGQKRELRRIGEEQTGEEQIIATTKNSHGNS